MHGVPVDKVHFHEVGAVDAIVDIAGACTGLDWLCTAHGMPHVRVSQLRLGRGQTRTEHGMMPVPPPAVLQLLEGVPVQWGEAEGERVTPTGAALVTALASPLGNAVVRVRPPATAPARATSPTRPTCCGWCCAKGKRDAGGPAVPGDPLTSPPVRPRASRARGRAAHHHRRHGAGVLWASHGEAVRAGAFDVQYTAVQGKKERPATQVTVIAPPEAADRLAGVLLTESTTLGVRVSLRGALRAGAPIGHGADALREHRGEDRRAPRWHAARHP